MVDARYFAGVELGGTKCIAVLAQGNRIVERIAVPTTTPDETLPALNQQLRLWHAQHPFEALGIASFGPIQLNRADPAFGCILHTPKLGWSDAPVAATLTWGLSCPWNIDTDVNAAALAEYLWGAGQGYDNLCYLTIGTGVGGGLLIGGQQVRGAMHPEIGHLRLRRAAGDTFAGSCPFHGDCVEGLICGPALERRFDMHPTSIPDDHPTWQFVVSDLAEIMGAILLTVSSQRILVGGSVAMSRTFLLPDAADLVVKRFGNYLHQLRAKAPHEIVQQAGLGDQAGPLGAIALAQQLRSVSRA